MKIDTIIAIKKIDSIIDKYNDTIEWLKESYPSRIDLTYSLEQSILRLGIVRKDMIMLDHELSLLEWI